MAKFAIRIRPSDFTKFKSVRTQRTLQEAPSPKVGRQRATLAELQQLSAYADSQNAALQKGVLFLCLFWEG